ncbi:MAG: sterol desaturase family protein [Cytophagales bacterium]
MEIIAKYSSMYGVTVFRYLLLSGIPFFLFYVVFSKKFAKSKIQLRLASSKDFFGEILHSLQSSLVLTLVGYLVLFTPFRNFTLIYAEVDAYPIWWLPVSLFLALLVHDTYFYWMHRALHHKSLFSKTHKVHHLSTNPSPWASYSFHLIEAFTEAFVLVIIVFTIPMHPISILSFTIVGFLINVYGHLGFEIMPKGFRSSILFQWLNTSVYHNLHHSKFKGNYSLYFRHWDKWMKTENPDYENTYDLVQEKRFGSNMKSFERASTSKVLLIIPLLLFFGSVNAQIEGKWQSETGDILKIYKEKGLYFGKGIATANQEEMVKLQFKDLIILREFKAKGENQYCCGSIYLPRRKMIVTGEITLKDKNTMQVTGNKGLISHTMVWKKVAD